MNPALKVFSVREAYVPDYSVPSVDVLSDDASFNLYVPDAPVLVKVYVGTLTFQPSANALGFRLFRKTGAAGYELIESVANPTLTTFTSGIIANAFYRVEAYNSVGNSPPSNALFLPLPNFVLDEGSGISTNRFTLTWSASYGAAYYKVFTSNSPLYNDTPAGVSTYGAQTDVNCGNNLTIDIGQQGAYVSGWEWYLPRFAYVEAYDIDDQLIFTSNEVVVVSPGVISISPTTLDSIEADVEMTPVDFNSTASFLPTTWSLTTVLPPGLSFDTDTGILSGTPTVVGFNYFTITATDAQHVYSIEVELEVTVNTTPAPQNFRSRQDVVLPMNDAGSRVWGANHFVAASSYSLTSVDMGFSRFGSETGFIRCHIYATTGGSGAFGDGALPTGSPLATSDNTCDITTLPNGSWTNDHSPFTFTFGTPLALTSGVTYAIVINAESFTGVAYAISGASYGSEDESEFGIPTVVCDATSTFTPDYTFAVYDFFYTVNGY